MYDLIFSPQLQTSCSLFGIAWGIMGIVFLIGKDRKDDNGRYFAIALILVMIASLIQTGIQLFYPMIHRITNPLWENHSLPILYGPLFYLYMKCIISEYEGPIWKSLQHFIPFVIIFLLEILLRGQLFELSRRNSPIIMIHSSLGAVSILIYGFLVLQRLRRFGRSVVYNFSSKESSVTLSWLRYLSIGYMVLFGLSYTVLFSLRVLTPERPLFSTGVVTILPLSLFILYFSYYSTRQTPLFADEEIVPTEEVKYGHSSANVDEMDGVARLVIDYMEREKPFLDDELSLEKFSQLLGISRHKLSQVLNANMGMTFYTFINSYRITEFEHLLKEERHKELSMLGLAYECGFKSSSSFYNTIKKERGMTPKELAKQLSAS